MSAWPKRPKRKGANPLMDDITTTTNTAAEGGSATPDTGERSFTQAEVNRIVSERLGKEKGKAEAALAEREQELARREFIAASHDIMKTKGLPVKLLDALNATDEKSLIAALDILDGHFQYSNPNPAYSQNPDGTFSKLAPGEFNIPPAGNVTKPDDNIRRAMGLK